MPSAGTVLRIATRRSALARRQSELVARMLREATGDRFEVRLVPFVTRGDRTRGKLADAGGKGLFTAELEAALRAGQVDLAVHSAKDLPAEMDADFALAVPSREDPRDAIVSRHGRGLQSLPAGATVGTGSARRRAQLLRLRADLNVVDLRGNVDTRLMRAIEQGPDALDAAVLAMAGLNRLGLSRQFAAYITPLEIGQMVPAAGQGLLALQYVRRSAWAEEIAAVGSAEPAAALQAERAVVRGLGADCHSCLGVHVAPTGPAGWGGHGMVTPMGSANVLILRVDRTSAAEAGEELLRRLREAEGSPPAGR